MTQLFSKCLAKLYGLYCTGFWCKRKEHFISLTRVWLIFLKCCCPFPTLYWVNKRENIYPTNFPSPYIIFLTATENKFTVWNYSFSGPNVIYLLEFSNINSRIKCGTCSKLTIKAPEVVLVSLLLTLNIFGHVVQVFFSWIWICKCQMEYFIALI